jgi:hypothetical protein
LLRSKVHLDACIATKDITARLTERGFNVENHYRRFGHPVPEDEDWVPMIAGEGQVILTADRGGDGVMLKELAKYRCPAILVSLKFTQTKETFLDRLCEMAKRIDIALACEPLIVWLSLSAIEASRHSDMSVRAPILGNGTVQKKRTVRPGGPDR